MNLSRIFWTCRPALCWRPRGAKVALLARSTDALQKLAQELPGSLAVTVDMTQFDRVRKAVGAVHGITAASTVS